MKSSPAKMFIMVIVSILFSCSNSANAEEVKPTEPKPTIELRVTANNQVLKPDLATPLKLGEAIQLKIEIVRPDGSTSDVTNNSKTSYFSITPWSVSITKTGLVTATSTLKDPEAKRDIGSIAITHGIVGDRGIGATSVLFEVRE